MSKLILRVIITIFCVMIAVPAFAAQRAYITEGWYKIVPAHSKNKALDVGGAKTNPGANIQLWDYVGADQQKFYIKHIQNRWYSIKAGNCDLYVDAQGGVPRNGENVHLWSWNGTDAQLWGFYDTGDGFNIETKMQSNLIFDCNGGRGDNGTNVQLWQKGNVAWHRWILIPVEAPKEKFVYPLSDMYVCGNNWGTYYPKKRAKHLGIDVKSRYGDDNVYAPASGHVVQTGYNSDNGNTITIEHNINGQRFYTFYGHLASINVGKGAKVSKGQKIGIVGNTGRSSTGKHLHFAITTQLSSGTYGYGSVNGNVGVKNGYRFYNPYYVIQNNRLP